MQGNIAQALALVVAGNSVLQRRDPGVFWPENAVFEFTKRCQFLSPTTTGAPTLSPDIVAQTPPEWFVKETPGCLGFRLHQVVRANPTDIKAMDDNRMSVIFVGGGPRWLIETVRQDASEVWEGRDEVLDRSAADRRIWATTYLRIASGRIPDLPSSRGPTLIAADLAGTLPQISKLASEIDISWAIQSFDAAERALAANPPVGDGYYSDLAHLFPLRFGASSAAGRDRARLGLRRHGLVE